MQDTVFQTRSSMSPRQLTIVACLSCLVCGCAKYHFEPEPLQPETIAGTLAARRLDDAGLREFMRDYGYAVNPWPRAEWDLETLTLAAYYFNPELQIAIARHGAARIREEISSQRINPRIGFPFEHHSDTSGGRSPWLIGVILDVVFERADKRRARQDQAAAESAAAATDIRVGAWNIYSRLRQRYLDVYALRRDEEYLRQQAEITGEILEMLERRLALGLASEFEVSATRLDLQRARLALNSRKIALVDAHHALAAAAGIPAAALDAVDLGFQDVAHFSADAVLAEKDLQSLALLGRFDIRKALQEYAAHEAALRLEMEKQFPDIVLSPGFVFDQDDKIWALGAAWVLPLFQPVNEGPVREALAGREVLQAAFLDLQSRALNELAAARARLSAEAGALAQSEALLGEVRERERQMLRQFELGYVDHLQLHRSRLETLAAEQAAASLQQGVINAVGRLEDAVHYPLLNGRIPAYAVQADRPGNAAGD